MIRSLRFPIILLAFAFLSVRALALEADNLLLIVNKNVPEGQRLAEHYAQARHVPDGRILALDLPNGDELPFEQYESSLVPAIREYLKDHDLERQVSCLVTFYGVPLKIGARGETPQLKLERAQLDQMLADIARELTPTVERAEKFASELDASFVALKLDRAESSELELLVRRFEHVGAFVNRRLEQQSDPAKRQAVLDQFDQIVKDFMSKRSQAAGRDGPATRAATTQLLAALNDRRFDAQARRELRDAAARELPLAAAGRVIAAQRDYLLPDKTDAALDNELALLWWGFYPRAQWEPNPLFYRHSQARTPAVLMVMRLDAPKPEIVEQIIDASVRAETDGLKGNVVLDAGGGAILDPAGKNPSYHEYDRSLVQLAELLRRATQMAVTLDRRPQLLPPNSQQDVALYCGWYSPGKYAPCAKFVSGAVGFHVASFEMTSLHDPQNTGWCRGLLNDGIAATIGPVAEPYLHAFPQADDFFPLLLTGKLTFAEIYWRTNPLVSWRMAAVGDPLYTPYRTNPQITVENLPPRLRSIFEPVLAPVGQ